MGLRGWGRLSLGWSRLKTGQWNPFYPVRRGAPGGFGLRVKGRSPRREE
jgi:hypothetical protein